MIIGLEHTLPAKVWGIYLNSKLVQAIPGYRKMPSIQIHRHFLHVPDPHIDVFQQGGG